MTIEKVMAQFDETIDYAREVEDKVLCEKDKIALVQAIEYRNAGNAAAALNVLHSSDTMVRDLFTAMVTRKSVGFITWID